jgi:hypothetical protein
VPFPSRLSLSPPPHSLTPKGGERHLEEIEGGKKCLFRRVQEGSRSPFGPPCYGGGKREEVPAPFGDRRSFYGGNRPPFLPPSMRLRRITLIRCPEGTGCGGMGVRRDPSRSPFGPPMLWGGESGRKCRPPRSLSRLGAQGKSLPLFQG